MLNNAVRQTEKKDYKIGPDTLRELISAKLSGVDFAAVRKDVERFLEDKSELKLLSYDTFVRLV